MSAHAVADHDRAPAGRDLRRPARRRPGVRAARLRRLLPLRPPTCGSTPATPAPAPPTRGRRWPGWPGRPAGSGSARWSLCDLPLPGPARDHRGHGRRDERRPGRARARHRLVRRRARGRSASRSRRWASGSTGSRSSSRSSPACGRRPPARPFSFTGTHYPLTDNPGLPKPVQQPHPPIIIGGTGARAYAARWPRGSPLSTTCRSDRSTSRPSRLRPRPGGVRAGGPRPGDAGALRGADADRAVPTTQEVRRRAAAAGRTWTTCGEPGLGGTADEVVDKIGRLRRAGRDRVYLQVLDLADLDHLRLVAEQVVPKL